MTGDKKEFISKLSETIKFANTKTILIDAICQNRLRKRAAELKPPAYVGGSDFES